MRASRLGFLLLVVHPSVALAQVQAISVNVNGGTNSLSGSFTYQLLNKTCEDQSAVIPVSWSAATNDLLFWTTDSTCGIPDGGIHSIASTTSVSSGVLERSASIKPSDIL